ncbi:MAG: AAA family ATPase, partial [Acidimicrobiales bacterium]
TSNNTRELSEALKRRCLYLHLDYPDPLREREIIRTHVPSIDDDLAAQVARVVARLRSMDLRKVPSVSETLDWARTLVIMGTGKLDEQAALDGLPVLLKHENDIERAANELLGVDGA